MAKAVESDSSFHSRASPDTGAFVKQILSSRNLNVSLKLSSVLLNKCWPLEISKWHFVGYPSFKAASRLCIHLSISSDGLMHEASTSLQSEVDHWSPHCVITDKTSVAHPRHCLGLYSEPVAELGGEYRFPTLPQSGRQTFSWRKVNIQMLICRELHKKKPQTQTHFLNQYSYFCTIFPMRLKNLLHESICFFKIHFKCNFFFFLRFLPPSVLSF